MLVGKVNFLLHGAIFLGFFISEVSAGSSKDTVVHKIFTAVSERRFEDAYYHVKENCNCLVNPHCVGKCETVEYRDAYGDEIEIEKHRIRSLVKTLEENLQSCSQWNDKLFNEGSQKSQVQFYLGNTNRSVESFSDKCSPDGTLSLDITEIIRLSGIDVSNLFLGFKNNAEKYFSDREAYLKKKRQNEDQKKEAEIAHLQSPQGIKERICASQQEMALLKQSLASESKIESIGGVVDLKRKRSLAEQILTLENWINRDLERYQRVSQKPFQNDCGIRSVSSD